jgi:hypothetical protein
LGQHTLLQAASPKNHVVLRIKYGVNTIPPLIVLL